MIVLQMSPSAQEALFGPPDVFDDEHKDHDDAEEASVAHPWELPYRVWTFGVDLVMVMRRGWVVWVPDDMSALPADLRTKIRTRGKQMASDRDGMFSRTYADAARIIKELGAELVKLKGGGEFFQVAHEALEIVTHNNFATVYAYDPRHLEALEHFRKRKRGV